ncbi:hypothetical protein C1645_813762 [Glomus cerebriforme]|uniref:Uncharacterized protein n=1 Tax=Glomus cerebriforme TaxID=658196 RepID=A0A397TID3_9GLOM|nr:hypothetical protein C1645_813762 [Glomus cerebriforme]
MFFQKVFNSIISRQYTCIPLTSAPQRRSLIFIVFSGLCAIGIIGLLCFGSLKDLDFDFSVPVLDSKNTGGVLHSKADVCDFDYSAIDIAWDRKGPYISFVVDNELVTADKKIVLENIFTRKQICTIVVIPDSIINNSRENEFTNKNIYVRALSKNVFRIIPVISVPNHKNFYQGVEFFNYPDDYSLNITIELPGRKDITAVSKNILSLSLSETFYKESSSSLSICNSTSEFTGQWVSTNFYDTLCPFTRHLDFLDVDNDYIFIPDQCKLRLITPIEQLLYLENQTIHAYGDEFLWGSLFGIESGYQKIWCEERGNLDQLCSCNFPTPSYLIGTQFANLNSSMFGSSLFFHPINDLLETKQKQKSSWKVALKQTSRIPKADIVIISVSNSIFTNPSKSLQNFKTKLTQLLSNIKNNYPNSTIFVRTPEPFTLSRHIPNVSRIRYLQVRDVTLNVAKEIGMYLWDVGILDGKDWDMPRKCVTKLKKQLWFKRDVVKLESQFLFHSLL